VLPLQAPNSYSFPKTPNAVISRKNGSSKSYYFQDPSPSDDSHLMDRGENNKLGLRITSMGLLSKDPYHLMRKVKLVLRSTFLPSGYPHKTPPGYLSYSIWSWIQDLSTQLRGTLATQRVLEGIGVGREGATALSASLNFIMRDGCGMASTLLFTAAAASKFRGDVKRWRLFADLINDIGITLEVAATLVPRHLFLPMICAGNMCKAICGVAAGACNGAINLHWARGSDISDINAKFGAQHTVTGSLGLVFAATFARSVSATSQLTLWTLYSALTVLHIVANMQCLKLIAFDHLNTSRIDAVVKAFLLAMEKSDKKIDEIIPLDTPMKIAKSEPLYFGARSGFRRLSAYPIRIGVSFNTLAHLSRRDKMSLSNLSSRIKSDQYVISVGDINGKKKGQAILVAFGIDANGRVKSKAYLHAMILCHILQKYDISATQFQTLEEKNIMAETTAAARVESLWSGFAKSAHRAGWDLEGTELRSEGYELSLK